MPRARPTSSSALDWLERARGKLALARQPLPPDAFLEDLCFFAQQAAELAVKAVYVKQGEAFPFIHDLGRLLDGLEAQGIAVPPDAQSADQLTLYATQTRYPGAYAPVSQQEYRDAVTAAAAAVAWAESLVSSCAEEP